MGISRVRKQASITVGEECRTDGMKILCGKNGF